MREIFRLINWGINYVVVEGFNIVYLFLGRSSECSVGNGEVLGS